MRCLAIICAAVVTSGCADRVLWLGFPPSEAAETLVVATPGADHVDLMALDPTNERSTVHIDVDPAAGGDRATHAVVFDAPLSAFGIEPGPLLEPTQTAHAVPLMDGPEALFSVAPDRVFAARIYEAQDDADWETIDVAPAWVRQRLVVRPPPRCPTFVPEGGTSQLDGFVTYAIPLDEHVALLRLWEGPTYAAGNGNVVEVTPPGRDFTAAHVAADGRIWLGDTDGRLWTARGHLPEIFVDLEMVADTGLREPIESITLDGPDDVFVVAYNGGAIAHYDGDRWRRVGAVGLDRFGDIQWTAPGQAMLRAYEQPGLHVITRDGITFDDVSGASPQSLAWVPGIGAVIGTESGRFYRRDGDAWSAIEMEAFGWWSASMLPYDGGFLFHLASGVGGFFHPEIDPCIDVFTTGLLVDSRLVPQGRDVLVVSLASDAQRTYVSRYARR